MIGRRVGLEKAREAREAKIRLSISLPLWARYFGRKLLFFFWKSEPIAMDGFLLRRGASCMCEVWCRRRCHRCGR